MVLPSCVDWPKVHQKRFGNQKGEAETLQRKEEGLSFSLLVSGPEQRQVVTRRKEDGDDAQHRRFGKKKKEEDEDGV